MKFCRECGAPLGAVCPSCSATNPVGYKFCRQCGSPLDAAGLREGAAPMRSSPRVPGAGKVSTLPGEMKQVTGLFCDIVNSTPLTERLGAERMRDFGILNSDQVQQ